MRNDDMSLIVIMSCAATIVGFGNICDGGDGVDVVGAAVMKRGWIDMVKHIHHVAVSCAISAACLW